MTEKKVSVLKTAAILLLIFVFAASALLTAVLSAGVFNNISAKSNFGSFSRTNLLYAVQKIRAYNTAGGVRIDSYGENDALVLTDTVDGTAYETWIYIENDTLCEVTVKDRAAITEGVGQYISEAASLNITESSPGLYTIELTDSDGGTASVRVYASAVGGEDDAL